MANAADWVPMRRPPGWETDAILRLLRGTPVNCLIDSGKTHPPGIDTPDVPFVKQSRFLEKTASPVLAVTSKIWPGIRLSRDSESGENDDTVETGPTGVPWVESNGWFVRLARAMAPGRPVWIAQNPPEKGPVSAESYMLAVADTAAHGGRWVVSLDKRLSGELDAPSRTAGATWRKIVAALAFFETHRAWLTYAPQGALAVLSDFAGPNEFLSTEILKLLPRRHVPFLILDRTRVDASAFSGLKAILYPDQDPPGAKLRRELLGFAERGGTVISPIPSAALAGGLRESPGGYHRYRICVAGEGRIAVAREEQRDPYAVAADAHTLLSRAHDLLRVWNGGPTNTYYSAAPNGEAAVIHVLNYSRRPVREVSMQVRRPYRAARLWTLDFPEARPLSFAAGTDGVEIHLPPISVYAAVELEA